LPWQSAKQATTAEEKFVPLPWKTV